MTFIEKVQTALAPTAQAMGFEWVGCELLGGNHSKTLRIYIDGPSGITIDQCAQLSRQMGGILDVEELIQGRYTLEVSSPGIARPLFVLEHYVRFVGRKIRIRLRAPVAGQRNFRGILSEVADTQVTIQAEDGALMQIDFCTIEKANLE